MLDESEALRVPVHAFRALSTSIRLSLGLLSVLAFIPGCLTIDVWKQASSTADAHGIRGEIVDDSANRLASVVTYRTDLRLLASAMPTWFAYRPTPMASRSRRLRWSTLPTTAKTYLMQLVLLRVTR